MGRCIMKREFKAFDILLNNAAGEKNPNKITIFLRYSGKFIICVNSKGHEIRFYISVQEQEKHLIKIASIDKGFLIEKNEKTL
jgi:hypothetical protein